MATMLHLLNVTAERVPEIDIVRWIACQQNLPRLIYHAAPT